MILFPSFCKQGDLQASAFKRLILGTTCPCAVDFIIPCLVYSVFIICCIFRVHHLLKHKKLCSLRSKYVHVLKITCCLILTFIPAFQMFGKASREIASSPWGTTILPFEYAGFGCAIGGWAFLSAVKLLELKYYDLSGNWIFRFLVFFSLASMIIKLWAISTVDADILQIEKTDVFYYLFIVQFSLHVLLCFFALSYFPNEKDLVYCSTTYEPLATDELDEFDLDQYPSEKQASPEESANLISTFLFSWMTPLMISGYKAPLVEEDVWYVSERDSSRSIHERFSKFWQKEYALYKNNVRRNKANLLRALRKVFWVQFTLGGIFKLGNDASQFIGPIVLKKVMAFVKSDEENYIGYLLIGVMFLSQIGGALCEGQYFQKVMRCGLQVRTALTITIFKKAMTQTSGSRQQSGSGKIATLISADAENLQFACANLHTIWSSPLRIVVSMVLLYQELGPSCFVGLAILILMLVSQKFIVGETRKLTKKSLGSMDERVSITTEVIGAINVVKCYSWEKSFYEKISDLRGIELSWIRKTAILSGLNQFFIGSVPILVTVVSFAVFVALGNTLTPGVAFTSLALFNVLRMPLITLPNVITNISTSKVALDRIQEFLLSDEYEEKDDANILIDENKPVLLIENASFSWDQKSHVATLKDINVSVENGQLVSIIGGTGSGKSSLLSSILGELYQSCGNDIKVQGKIAYVPQQAWIFNATVRDNIVFGLPFDADRYQETIQVCSLSKDFLMLVDGDMTEIGEKGINLSGGQKQRISLARAVYSQPDIFLFDDPLSALDAHVAKEIYDRCFCNYLKDKTRIFATNRLEFLGASDAIWLVENGKIEAQGSFEKMNENESFKELVGDIFFDNKNEDEVITDLKESKFEHVQLRPDKKKENQKDLKLIEKEERQMGGVGLGLILAYVKAIGGNGVFIAILFFYALTEAFRLGSSFWIQIWSDGTLEEFHSVWFYLGIYTLWCTLQILSTLINQMIISISGVKGGKTLQDSMLKALLRAPMSFFHSTPIGRIINRISKDLSDVDRSLSFATAVFLRGLVQIFGSLIVIGINTPYTLALFVPVLCLFYWLYRYFQATNRELKRLDAVTRSPVYSHFNQCLNGISSIRAYGAYDRVYDQMTTKLDNQIRMNIASFSCNRWLTIRLEFLGSILVVGAGVFAVAGRNVLASGQAGLTLSYALQITGLLNMAIRLAAIAENSLNSVERLIQYSNIEPEAPNIIDDNRPKPSWPASGAIEFTNVSMRYREDTPLVLKSLSFKAKPGERVGICGRTGAGKSSLFLTLFRLCEPESDGGSIILDDMDISLIGLLDLRSRLSIIPQDPVLFTGTVRFNLDPFNQHEDFKLWDALERSHIKKVIEADSLGLEAVVRENGENFSVGQRQLLCLARALLRNAKVLVLDEATAAVDVVTDSLIQKTIREEFTDCTILAIAHRLLTIADYDQIIVLEAGEMVECGTPAALLSQHSGKFLSMVNDTGEDSANLLKSIAFGEKSVIDDIDVLHPEEVNTNKLPKDQRCLERRLSQIDQFRWPTKRLEDVRISLNNIKRAITDEEEWARDDSIGNRERWLCEIQHLVKQLGTLAEQEYENAKREQTFEQVLRHTRRTNKEDEIFN